MTADWKLTCKIVLKFQSKSSEELRKERRAEIDAQSVFTKLKTKKISQKTKKAVARQSLHHIMSHSQKNFSNFRNSFGGQNLGIVHKRVTTERESERAKKELQQLEKELGPEKLAMESERAKEPGVSSGMNTSEAAMRVESKGASSSVSETLTGTACDVGKPQCLVSYDMSASDSDGSCQ